jgi:hypothetical protein
MKHVGVTVVTGSAIAWIAWVPSISRVAWVADVAKVSQVFVDHHVMVKFTHVATTKTMDVGPVYLTDCAPIHPMDVPICNVSDCRSPRVVKVLGQSESSLIELQPFGPA